MSKILTASEAETLTAEKHDLMDKAIESKSQGESDRLSKQIVAIQRQLDDDLNERRRTGFDEARSKAASIAFGATRTTGGPSKDELRAFVTPGSPTTQMWINPPREQVMGRASDYGMRSAYLTTDTATTGSAYYFLPESL